MRTPVLFGALLLLFAVFFLVNESVTAPTIPIDSDTVPPAPPTSVATIASSSPVVPTTPPTATTTATTTQKAKKATVQATKSTQSPQDSELKRIENPYTSPPLSFETVNISTRAALVNIYCSAPSFSSVRPITGSGAIIDSRGVILTNAHVAQYVLIAQSKQTDLTCVIRTGGPAVSKWRPVVLYIPPIWIEKHAHEIIQSNAKGTGEHDFALLYINTNLDESPAHEPFPTLGYDAREAIGFIDDTVLTASYPVEFAGSTVINNNLYPVTSISTIKQLLTFRTGTADVISLGGIIQAQRGASGGVVVNQWNKVIGLVTTTSDGATTGERDLHAITTASINRDLIAQKGESLDSLLSKDPGVEALNFQASELPRLSKLLIDAVSGN
jgi:hypothetical protein